jgi:DNA-directed RNA polymerase subunit RPC12/RpoP
MDTVKERSQTATIPRCVYCESRMSAAPRKTAEKNAYLQFICNDCGWEVSVPLE